MPSARAAARSMGLVAVSLGFLAFVDHYTEAMQTLAIILPNLLVQQRDHKRDKLLQYASRVWALHDGSSESRIDRAIVRTREFFESLGVATHLSAYGITAEALPPLLTKLEQHGRFPLGERQSLQAEDCLAILNESL